MEHSLSQVTVFTMIWNIFSSIYSFLSFDFSVQYTIHNMYIMYMEMVERTQDKILMVRWWSFPILHHTARRNSCWLVVCEEHCEVSIELSGCGEAGLELKAVKCCSLVKYWCAGGHEASGQQAATNHGLTWPAGRQSEVRLAPWAATTDLLVRGQPTRGVDQEVADQWRAGISVRGQYRGRPGVWTLRTKGPWALVRHLAALVAGGPVLEFDWPLLKRCC